MTFEDWRDASPEAVRGLFEVETRRWHHELGWETAALWSIVDEGRRHGHVQGWILRDREGRAAGWTYYLLHDGGLQIGALTADRSTGLRLLLDRVLESPEAGLASSVSAFVYPAPAALISALTRRRFAVRRSLYLRADVSGTDAGASVPVTGMRVRPFVDRDLFPVTRLLASAYTGVAGGECFAPHGRLDEWARYVRQLIETPACGTWLAPSSLVAERESDRAVVGVVLATRLSSKTAHLAQIAVAADQRGTGVGRGLIARARQAAATAGYSGVSLMVDDANETACRLYGRLGFEPRSTFVYARRRGRIRQASARQRAGRLAG
jgi:ribosomal protein S18 acetylase RimI-like enzyme